MSAAERWNSAIAAAGMTAGERAASP